MSFENLVAGIGLFALTALNVAAAPLQAGVARIDLDPTAGDEGRPWWLWRTDEPTRYRCARSCMGEGAGIS